MESTRTGIGLGVVLNQPQQNMNATGSHGLINTPPGVAFTVMKFLGLDWRGKDRQRQRYSSDSEDWSYEDRRWKRRIA